MPRFDACFGCSFYRLTTGGFECMSPSPCKHKYEPRFFWSNVTKPYGYRTPEDRLAEIERRLDRLEGRDGRYLRATVQAASTFEATAGGAPSTASAYTWSGIREYRSNRTAGSAATGERRSGESW